jgi:phosphoglycerate dehydrogenase-like enzyme
MSTKTLNQKFRVGVCSRSFSQNPLLVRELENLGVEAKLNVLGRVLDGDDLRDFLSDCDGAIIGLEIVDNRLVSQLPRMNFIAKYGVGLDNIIFDTSIFSGIRVFSSQGVNAQSVVELVLMFALVGLRNFSEHSAAMNGGIFANSIGLGLREVSFGIVGVGAIGSLLVKTLRSLGHERIFVYDVDETKYRNIGPHGITVTKSIEDLFGESEIVSLHVPGSRGRSNLVGADILNLAVKSSPRLRGIINTSRGGVVDESAVTKLLESREIEFAGFDVFANERPFDTPLRGLTGFLGTPHIGGSTRESVLAMGRGAIMGVRDYLGGVKC